jgi:hypothetical protein
VVELVDGEVDGAAGLAQLGEETPASPLERDAQPPPARQQPGLERERVGGLGLTVSPPPPSSQ